MDRSKEAGLAGGLLLFGVDHRRRFSGSRTPDFAIPAALNIAMAALCFGAAYCLFSGGKLPRVLTIPIVLLALLHLVNIFTFLLFAARVQSDFLTPLFLLSAFVPTNTGFTSWIPGISIFPASGAFFAFLYFLAETESKRRIHHEIHCAIPGDFLRPALPKKERVETMASVARSAGFAHAMPDGDTKIAAAQQLTH